MYVCTNENEEARKFLFAKHMLKQNRSNSNDLLDALTY